MQIAHFFLLANICLKMKFNDLEITTQKPVDCVELPPENSTTIYLFINFFVL